jgi:hypothetical protein
MSVHDPAVPASAPWPRPLHADLRAYKSLVPRLDHSLGRLDELLRRWAAFLAFATGVLLHRRANPSSPLACLNIDLVQRVWEAFCQACATTPAAGGREEQAARHVRRQHAAIDEPAEYDRVLLHACWTLRSSRAPALAMAACLADAVRDQA